MNQPNQPNQTVRLTALAAAFVTAAMLQGCATPATPQAMSIDYSDVAASTMPELKGVLVVRNVSGGKATNPALDLAG